MLAALGDFVFDLASLPFSELKRKRDWRHARGQRVGARDVYQFTGPGEDRVSLPGSIVPGVAGGFAAIDTLRDMADSGEVFQLVDGAFRVWGGFVIESLDETRRHLMVDGTPRLVDFTIELARAV